MHKHRMLQEAGFLKGLWPEIVKAAADLLNLTLTKSINWQSALRMLYHCLKLFSPTLAYLYIYGLLTYIHNLKVAVDDNFKS
jgi:hypothetical protein